MRLFPWWTPASKRTRTEVVIEWLLAQYKAKQEDRFLDRATKLVFTALMRILPGLLEEELRRLGIIKQAEGDQEERRRKPGWEALFEREVARFLEAARQEMVRQKVPSKYIKAGIAASFHQVTKVNETTRKEMRRLMAEMLKQPRPDQFKLARQITERWSDISRQRARVIAVTEWRRMSSLAHHLEAKDAGARYKMWLTVGDPRVCLVCASYMARGQIPIDDYWFDSLHPPAHPRCRCTVTYYTKLRPDLQPPSAGQVPPPAPPPTPVPPPTPTKPIPVSFPKPDKLPFPTTNLPTENQNWASRAYAYTEQVGGDFRSAWERFLGDTDVWPADLRQLAVYLEQELRAAGTWERLDPDIKLAFAYVWGWRDDGWLSQIADMPVDVVKDRVARLMAEGLKLRGGRVTVTLPQLLYILDRRRTFAVAWASVMERAVGTQYAIMDLDTWYKPIPHAWLKQPSVVDQLKAKRSVALECALKADLMTASWGDVLYLPITEDSWMIGYLRDAERAGLVAYTVGVPRAWTPVVIGPTRVMRGVEAVPPRIKRLVGTAKSVEDCERIGEAVIKWLAPKSQLEDIQRWTDRTKQAVIAGDRQKASQYATITNRKTAELAKRVRARLLSIRETLRSLDDIFLPPTDPSLADTLRTADPHAAERLPAGWFADYYSRPRRMLELRWLSDEEAESLLGLYTGFGVFISKPATEFSTATSILVHELLHEVDDRLLKVRTLVDEFARSYLAGIKPKVDLMYGLNPRYDVPELLPDPYMGVYDPMGKRLVELLSTGLADPVSVVVDWYAKYPRLARFLIGLWVGV